MNYEVQIRTSCFVFCMMTKEEHIEYWLKNAKRDWKRAELCLNSKDHVFALFCAHLCLEKICKALWVKHHKSNYPPRIHKLEKILSTTPVKLIDEDLNFLVLMNKYQLEGRYPDYRDKIYKICTTRLTKETLNKANSVKLCLIEKLQLTE